MERVRTPGHAGMRLALGSAALVLIAAQAGAHPMGNVSIARHFGVELGPSGCMVHQVVDLAEVPTAGAWAELGLAPGAAVASGPLEELRRRREATWSASMELAVDGRAVPLIPCGGRAVVTPGSGGLPTVRLESYFGARWPALDAGEHRLQFAPHDGHSVVGYRELVLSAATAARVVASNVPASSPTAALVRYGRTETLVACEEESIDARFAVGAGVVPGDGSLASTPPATRRDPRVASVSDDGPAPGLEIASQELSFPGESAPRPARGPWVLAAIAMAGWFSARRARRGAIPRS